MAAPPPPPRFFSVAGAPEYLHSARLYERKPVTGLWNKLTLVAKQQWKWKNIREQHKDDPAFFRSKRRILQVYGPPGCGKSSATFSWARHVCQTLGVKVIWLSCAAEMELCWSIERDVNGAVEGQHVPVKVDDDQIPQNAGDVDDAMIVVFDGIRRATLERWRGLMNQIARLGIAVIVVSSEGVSFHAGDSQDIMKLNHFVPSWTKEEYLAASRDTEFWNTIHRLAFKCADDNDDEPRREEFLDKKFAVAGHSARFMFNTEEWLVKAEIEEKVHELSGIESIEDAVRNTRSAGAVNTLVARLLPNRNGSTPQDAAKFPIAADLEATAANPSDFLALEGEIENRDPGSRPRLVSHYASEQVSKNVPTSIGRLRALASKLANKVIEGYAFEQQLLTSLKAAETSPEHSLAVTDLDGQAAHYPVQVVKECDQDDLPAILKSGCMPNTWIFVTKDQGCFDAVHVQSETHIRFIQATVGKSHTFYLDIIVKLLRKLFLSSPSITWSHIDFLVLRPKTDRDKEFSLNTARGALNQGYRRFDNEEWDLQEQRNNANYAFLEWTE